MSFKRFIGRNFTSLFVSYITDVANIRRRGLLRQSVKWRWPLRLWTTWYPLPRRPLGEEVCGILRKSWIMCSAFQHHLHWWNVYLVMGESSGDRSTRDWLTMCSRLSLKCNAHV